MEREHSLEIEVNNGISNLVTIFTPTYNRRELLERLYMSLGEQIDKGFEWLVVDDGSTDGTEAYIKSLVPNASFSIIYKRIDNGGKHRAINEGSKWASGYWFFIVDSDDILMPDTIQNYRPYLLQGEEGALASVSFLINDMSGRLIGGLFPENPNPVRYIEMWEKRYFGDRADVINTSILKKIGFPEFEDEKYLAESAFWLAVSDKHYSQFYNVFGYTCEYQADGLSSKSLRNRILSPQGAMHVYEKQHTMFRSLRLRAKAAANYWRFYLHSGRSNSDYSVAVPYKFVGTILYILDNMRLQCAICQNMFSDDD